MRLVAQIRRYLTTGAVAALTDFCIYGALIRFAGLTPLFANLISRPAGGLVSFTGNKIWTFEQGHIAGTGSQFLRFGIVWTGAYAASQAMVWLLGHRLGMAPFPAKIGAEAIACSGVFIAHRFWTFHTRRQRR